jgi:hypothetical protein
MLPGLLKQSEELKKVQDFLDQVANSAKGAGREFKKMDLSAVIPLIQKHEPAWGNCQADWNKPSN